HFVSQPREMTRDEEKSLLGALQKELKHPPAGVDKNALKGFVSELDRVVKKGSAASHTFDGAHMADVKHDPRGGLTATFGAGVDMGGTIHADRNGKLSWEMRPVMMHQQPLKPMSDADRASLAKNLEHF